MGHSIMNVPDRPGVGERLSQHAAFVIVKTGSFDS